MDYWEWYRERLLLERLFKELEKVANDQYIDKRD